MDCECATFSDASVFARKGGKYFDTEGTEGGFEGVADSFSITMESSDFVAVSIVDSLDGLVHGSEEGGGGLGECAGLRDMSGVFIDHDDLVSKSTGCFARELLGVKGDIVTGVGSRR